jgi:hypothetical protein
MKKLTREEILFELERRREDRKRIQEACHKHFVVYAKPDWVTIKPGQGIHSIPFRTERGRVHEAIARELGLKVNNVFCRKVAAALYELGITKVNLRNRLYYRGLEEPGRLTKRPQDL